MVPPDAAALAAQLTLNGFNAFKLEFRTITSRAGRHFELHEWMQARQDAIARFDAYDLTLGLVSIQLEYAMGGLAHETSLWIAAKGCFEELIMGLYDKDRAETFFNSVTRKMLHTVGINRDVEFFSIETPVCESMDLGSILRSYPQTDDTTLLVKKIFEDVAFAAGYENLERDAGWIARELDMRLWPYVAEEQCYKIDIVNAVFYRNKAAYILGRVLVVSDVIPFIIPLSSGDAGVYADAVLLLETEAGRLFSLPIPISSSTSSVQMR